MGLYTIEELHFSSDGVLLTRGPSQYKIPALCDVPAELNVHLLADAENPHAIYSSKVRSRPHTCLKSLRFFIFKDEILLFQGIGEPPVFFGSTVFFAIKAAIAAARRERGLTGGFPLRSPATAERIRMACEDQFTEMVRPELCVLFRFIICLLINF